MHDPAPILKRLREILSISGDRVGKARRISTAIHEAGFTWVGIYDGSGDEAVRLAWSPPSPVPPRDTVTRVRIQRANGQPVGILEAAGDGPLRDEDRRYLEACAAALAPFWSA